MQCKMCTFLSLFSVILGFAMCRQHYTLPEDYEKYMVPPGENGPLNIKVSLLGISVAKVLEKDRQIFSDLTLTYTWVDRRINITCNKCNRTRFPLSPEEGDNLWRVIPFCFEMKKLYITRGNIDRTVTVLNKDQSIWYLLSILLYSDCNFDFSMYPFDVQRCQIRFSAGGPYTDVLMMEWDSKTKGKFWTFTLPLFVVEICVVPDTEIPPFAPIAILRIVLIFHRQLRTQLLQIYLPSMIFVIVSWGGFVVPVEVIPGRMVLLVTTLLSLMTLFGSTRMEMPPALQIKAVEVWLLSCIVFVFLALLEFAFLLFFARRAEERKGDELWHKRHNYKNRFLVENKYSDLLALGLRQPNGPTARREGWKRCCLFSKSSTWNKLDKISLIVFPVMYACFVTGYWYFYINEMYDTYRGYKSMDKGCFNNATRH